MDDWLGWKREKESGITTDDRDVVIEEEKQWYTQEQIRQLNADFNYENYEQFYEMQEGSSPKKQEGDNDDKQEIVDTDLENEKNGKYGLSYQVNKDNLLFQMEKNIKLDEHFKANYTEWLEDEVWSYFDWNKNL